MGTISPATMTLLGCIAGIGIAIGWKTNPFRGIGVAAVGAFLIPTWNQVSIGEIAFDGRICLAVLAVTVAAAVRPHWIFSRLAIADILVTFLCLWQTLSEWNATEQILRPFLLSYGYWALPYLVGRCSARTVEDLKWLAYCFSGIGILFATTSLIESFTTIDLYEMTFGKNPGLELHTDKGHRWGFLRVEGPYRHPIFFGIALVLLAPWTFWHALTSCGRERSAAIAGCVSTVITTLSTVSRGPILALPIMLAIAGLMRFRKFLIGFLVTASFSLTFVAMNPDRLVGITQWFANTSGERNRAIDLGGEIQIHNSSSSRLLQLQHYRKSIRHAGMLGYGMTATDTFPPNVPFVPIDRETGKPYPIVDNSYVLLTLRGGWLECVGFVLLHIAALFQLGRLTRHHQRLVSLCRLLSGAICAHALLVFTVYPDYDFMFVFMWTVGISSVQLEESHSDNEKRTGPTNPDASLAELFPASKT